MPLSSVPAEDAITLRLKDMEGIDVYEGDYLDDGIKPDVDKESGFFVPYALIKYQGSTETADNGLGGPDKDMQRATFSVYLVTPQDRLTRQYRDEVRKLMLTDFRPPDSSSLKPNGGYSFTDTDLGYSRYVHVIGFRFFHNLS